MATVIRGHNTNRNGDGWTQQEINSAWSKGRVMPDQSSSIYRWDKCGSVMQFNQYGNRGHNYGWEIDHINPVANGGTDIDNNLQPLNWKNNAAKSDKLNWLCGQ
jgi:HNH endonuclease